MKSLEYAFGRMGLTAGSARSAVEGLANAISSNPGIQGLLSGLGRHNIEPKASVVSVFVAVPLVALAKPMA